MVVHLRHRESRVPESSSVADPDSRQGFASVFVTACDGLRLHVRRYGSVSACAHPVVCLPALARTAADFHPLATALAADPAKPRLVLALDYRGHGQSEYDRNPNNYTVRVALADLSTVLAALEVGSAIFVGTSLGGWDPFPYGFLTMCVSLEAIILSVFVLLSQNRQVARDRTRNDIEYRVNLKAELEIAHLHEKFDEMNAEVLERLKTLERRHAR